METIKELEHLARDLGLVFEDVPAPAAARQDAERYRQIKRVARLAWPVSRYRRSRADAVCGRWFSTYRHVMRGPY